MRLSAITTMVALVAGAAWANPIAPNDVQFDDYGGVEASLTGVAGDPANGKKIMTIRGKGNCVACHEVTALKDAPFHGEVGPTLDGIGGARNAAELRGLLVDAKKTIEGTVMPGFYKTSGFIRPGDGYTGKGAKEEDLTPILTAQEVEDVVAYLMTLTD